MKVPVIPLHAFTSPSVRGTGTPARRSMSCFPHCLVKVRAGLLPVPSLGTGSSGTRVWRLSPALFPPAVEEGHGQGRAGGQYAHGPQRDTAIPGLG